MKKMLSLLTIIMIISLTTISFAGFDEYGIYRVNETARILQLEADGVNILWQWSKGVTYTGEEPPNIADWAGIPHTSALLFDYDSAGDKDYLHLKKTYYTDGYNTNFHMRYMGENPIEDRIMYMSVCEWKFSKNKGVELDPFFMYTPWKVFQAERNIYVLTEIEPEVFEYVYYATENAGWWTNDLPEPPYGFGTVDK